MGSTFTFLSFFHFSYIDIGISQCKKELTKLDTAMIEAPPSRVEAVYLVLSTFTSDPNLAGLSKESRTAMANVSFHMKEKIKQYGPSSLGTSLFPAAQVCSKDGTDLWIRWMVRTLGLLNIRDSGGSQDGLLGPDTRERP